MHVECRKRVKNMKTGKHDVNPEYHDANKTLRRKTKRIQTSSFNY